MKDYFAHAAFRLGALVFLALSSLGVSPLLAGELRLLMFEQPGCVWCARWDAEIGPIYPKTSEAQAAPLTRLQLHAPLPDGVSLTRPARFTPTFVLIEDGTELGRIEGYPGEDFFWPMLDELLARADSAPAG